MSSTTTAITVQSPRPRPAPGPEFPAQAMMRSGRLPLEVRDLVRLLVGALLRPCELVLLLPLALLLTAFPPQRGVSGDVSRRLLGLAGDFVDQTHSRLLSSNRFTATRTPPATHAKPWVAVSRHAPAPIGLLGARPAPRPPRPRVLIPRRAGRAPHRPGDARPDSRAGHPPGLAGRMDLQRSPGPSPGDRDRRGRTQAVPLPRRLAGAPGPGEVRACPAVRPQTSGPSGPDK